MKDEERAIGGRLQRVDYGPYEIRLVTDKGVLALGCEGDCCSHSWFESCEELGALGGEITTVELDGGWTPPNDVGNGVELKTYFPAIKTTTGRVLIELRNESNGYYGGWVTPRWVSASQ